MQRINTNFLAVNYPRILLILYAILTIWSAYNPRYFDVWVAEAITSFITVAIIIFLYIRGTKFSNLAYSCMAIFPVMHMIGAHYTFEFVPFDWFNNLISSERNMYDRVAHFSVGLYSFAILEYIFMKGITRSKFFAYSYSIFIIMSVAALYEIFEWQYATISDPTAGIAILGSQGDIWDAQKDMLMDTLGGVTGAAVFYLKTLFKIKTS